MATTIPKKIHQIYLAPEGVLPEIYTRTQYQPSVTLFNPDYEYTLHTADDIKTMFTTYSATLSRYDHFYNHTLRDPEEKRQFASYMILYLFGGVYLDLNMQVRQSFNALLDTRQFVAVQLQNTKVHNEPQIFTGFLASVPTHDFFGNLLDFIMFNHNLDGKSLPRINTGSIALGRMAKKLQLLTKNTTGLLTGEEHPELFLDTPCQIIPAMTESPALYTSTQCLQIDLVAKQVPIEMQLVQWGEIAIETSQLTIHFYLGMILLIVLGVMLVMYLLKKHHYRAFDTSAYSKAASTVTDKDDF